MNVKIGQKIAAGYLSVLLVFTAAELLAYRTVTQSVDRAGQINRTHAGIVNMGDCLADIRESSRGFQGYLLTGQEPFLEIYSAGISGAEELAGALSLLLAGNPEQSRRMEEVGSLMNETFGRMREAVGFRTENTLDADQMMLEINSNIKAVNDLGILMDQMIAEEAGLLTEREEILLAGRRFAGAVIILSLVLSMILLSLLGLFIIRSVSGSLKQISELADRISAGDLSVEFSRDRQQEGSLLQGFSRMTAFLRQTAEAAERIAGGDLSVEISPQSSRDVLGNSLAAMIGSLRNQMQRIREASNALASSSGEISTTVAQLASNTTTVAISINETTTTVEELRQTARLSHEKSDQVAKGAQEVAQVSQAGMKLSEEMIGGMNHIQDQMRLIADSITSLSEQCQAIGEIIGSVNDLSEQSNLLAVNAAIEAAKAGEQGKGFVVVAEEIRRLAEGSKEATSQVQNILQEIQKGVSRTVMAVEKGTRAADSGVKQSAETGSAIRRLAQSMEEASRSVIQIAASSQQQLIGVDQVNDAMGNIRESSAQNSQGARQLEQASRDLSELGMNLEDLLSRYSI